MQGSFTDMTHTVDSHLMEIHPDRREQFGIYPRDPSAASPDDELLIRHSEYHRPHESKIVTAMKASEARRSFSDKTKKPSEKKMTLAELAKTGMEVEGNKDQPKPGSPSRSTTAAVTRPSTVTPATTTTTTVTPDITIETPSVDENQNTDALVRHSEFYKASKSSPRRRSNESLSSLNLEERRPTLADILEQKNGKDDDMEGNELTVDRDIMGSAESIYSTDGIFSNNAVSGEVFLGYQYLNGTLKIKIFEARGLTAIDKTKDTSDPYGKVYLLPDQSRAGKRKTKIKHATLNPEFNEEMLYNIGTRELLTRTIWLSLWNYDRFGRNEFLGEIRIPLDNYNGKEVPATWYQLSEMQPNTSDSQGELVVALMYSPADKRKKKKGANIGKLHVHIVEAKNLAGKDHDNLSDPFCKSYLLPDKSKKTKRKTPVMKRNLNPRWNHKFTYDNLGLDELESRVLELTVWDHDLGSSNDFLGGVRIGLGTGTEPWNDSEGEEVTLWQFLLSKPNTWTQSVLPLRNHMGSKTL